MGRREKLSIKKLDPGYKAGMGQVAYKVNDREPGGHNVGINRKGI